MGNGVMGKSSLGNSEPVAPEGATSARAGVEGVVLLGFLTYCDWEQRAAVAALSHEVRNSLGLAVPAAPPATVDEARVPATASVSGSSGVYWHLLCERLAQEHQVYVPMPKNPTAHIATACLPPPRGVATSWETLFREFFKAARDASRHPQEEQREADQEGEVFNIGVATRFRPARTAATEATQDTVVLPLHQKVQLVKEQYGVSSKDAVAMIMKERAKQKFGEQAIAAPKNGGIFHDCLVPENKENVDTKPNKMVVGATQGEAKRSDSPGEDDVEVEEAVDIDARCAILAVREDDASVLAVTRQSGLRDFRFNRVFGETSQQEDVYELSARRLVVEFLNGKSASVICYGQTGSGKTFTMFSPPATNGSVPTDLRGIVPRACEEILGALQQWRDQGHEAQLGVSYVEIFGSEVSDLLKDGQVVGQGLEGRYAGVRATDRVGHRYVLDGHVESYVDSWDDVDRLLQAGDDAKRRAATAMNERSTRAHSILVLSLTKMRSGDVGPPVKSRFFFADLGGSEQVSKSKTDAGTLAPVTVVGGVEQSRIRWEEYYRHRQRIQETLHINKGLFALKRVIEALHRRSNLAAEGVPQDRLPYVPYQDSKLTMMLQEALGGAARTLIVTTATLDPEHTAESLQTLRFAETCASVQKRTDADKAAAVKLALAQLEKDITQVEEEIRRKERWETQRVKRADLDTVAGAFGESRGMYEREEVVVKTVLVGAEEERKRLEWLLQRQTELHGLNTAAALGKHYEEMHVNTARDGGLGADWREKDKFQSKMKARDFEDEGVLADAIRFLFRKADGARDGFGETEETVTKRLTRAKIPAGYFRLARALRVQWEENTAVGSESRPFGKVCLDRCQAWSKQLKADPANRNSELEALFQECKYVPEDADKRPLPHEREQLAQHANSGGYVAANDDTPDEF